MESLTTILWEEIANNLRIYLSSGNMRFNWISVSDIDKVTTIALLHGLGDNQLELCTSQIYDFNEVNEKINQQCKTDLIYQSPWLISDIICKLRTEKSLSYYMLTC